MTVASNTSSSTSRFYEDLEPGLVIDLGSVTFSRQQVLEFVRLTGDVHPLYVDPAVARGAGLSDVLVPVTLVGSMTMGRLVATGILSESVVEVKGLNWQYRRSIVVGGELGVEMQVIHRELSADASRGEIGRRFILTSSDGQVVHEGLSDAVVLTRSSEAALQMEEAKPSFASAGWLADLVRRLGESKEFADATASFDGSVALHFGARSVGVRLYRGRIIDQGRAVVANATFSVGAPASTWLRFAARPRNEFISFAMGDAFEVRGSTYDYLRMTKALMLMTDEVRTLIR